MRGPVSAAGPRYEYVGVGRPGDPGLPQDVYAAELQEIRARRRRQRIRLGALEDPDPGRPSVRHGLIGLALSGGGIRSATFNLGILQALDRHGYLQFFDYLSTVSGGGYAGCCLSSAIASFRKQRVSLCRLFGLCDGATVRYRDSDLDEAGRDPEGRPYFEFSVPDEPGEIRLEIRLPEEDVDCTLRAEGEFEAPPGGPRRSAESPRPLPFEMSVLPDVGPLRGLRLEPRGNRTEPRLRISGRSAEPVHVKIRLHFPFPFRHEQGEVEPPAFRHLRDTANYLLPRLPLSNLRVPGLFVRGLIVNFISVLPFLLLFAAVTVWTYQEQIWAASQTRVFTISIGQGIGGPQAQALSSSTGYVGPREVRVNIANETRGMAPDYGIDLNQVPADIIATDPRPAVPFKLGEALDDRNIDFVIPSTVQRDLAFPIAVWDRQAMADRLGRVPEANPIFELYSSRFRITTWLVAAFAVLLALYPVTQTILSIAGRTSSWRARDYFTRYLCGGGLLVIGAVAFVEVQPLAIYYVETEFAKRGFTSLLSDGGQALTVAVTGLTAFLSMFSGKLAEMSNRLVPRLGLYLIGMLAPLSLWLVFLMFCRWAIFPAAIPRSLSGIGELDPLMYVAAAVAVFLFTRAFFNINKTSFHRFYRDRLADTFLFHPWRTSIDGDRLERNDEQRLSRLDTELGPYHLINATLNLQNARRASLCGRNGDFFLFSKRYVGGQLTGYVDTATLERAGEPDLTLATALAISGAAAAPNMGKSTITPLTFLMALLNIRLGYWMENPRVFGDADKRRFGTKLFSWFTRRIGPIYLIKEMLGRVNEESWYIHLTDGGHTENLGLYELVRRRCRFIVVSDAGADPEHTFGDLAHAIRLVQIDMGIKIDLKVDFIQVDPDCLNSRVHCATGIIHYNDRETGYLLYIKSSVTGDENVYVSEYKRRYALFPHQTTADQFFDESQFEAYRALGVHVGERILEGHHDRRLRDLMAELQQRGDETGQQDVFARDFLTKITEEVAVSPPGAAA